jgi:DNA-binding HxlR family transcriptional regulator
MGATNKDVREGVAPQPTQAESCGAVDEVVGLLGDKWTLLVLGALRHGKSLRYNEVQRAVVGISQRMLTLTLKRLEAKGLVKRTSFPTVPPRVDYELTPLGHSLATPLRAVLDWVLENRTAMDDARRSSAPTNADERS